jgi:hypothetical protein
MATVKASINTVDITTNLRRFIGCLLGMIACAVALALLPNLTSRYVSEPGKVHRRYGFSHKTISVAEVFQPNLQY